MALLSVNFNLKLEGLSLYPALLLFSFFHFFQHPSGIFVGVDSLLNLLDELSKIAYSVLNT